MNEREQSIHDFTEMLKSNEDPDGGLTARSLREFLLPSEKYRRRQIVGPHFDPAIDPLVLSSIGVALTRDYEKVQGVILDFEIRGKDFNADEREIRNIINSGGNVPDTIERKLRPLVLRGLKKEGLVTLAAMSIGETATSKKKVIDLYYPDFTTNTCLINGHYSFAYGMAVTFLRSINSDITKIIATAAL
jgi:hypothetical protein